MEGMLAHMLGCRCNILPKCLVILLTVRELGVIEHQTLTMWLVSFAEDLHINLVEDA